MDKLGGLCFWCPCFLSRGKRQPASKKQPIVLVIGTAVSGRDTAAQKLAETIGYTYLNMSALIKSEITKGKFRGKLLDEYIKKNTDIPADVLTGILKEHILDNVKGFIIAAFPLNVEQAKKFEVKVRKPNIIVFCSIAEEVYLARYNKKHGETIDEKILKQKYTKEHKHCTDIVKMYESKTVKITSSLTVAENNDKIITFLIKEMGYTVGE